MCLNILLGVHRRDQSRWIHPDNSSGQYAILSFIASKWHFSLIYLLSINLDQNVCSSFRFNRGHACLLATPPLYRHLNRQLVVKYFLFLAYVCRTLSICFFLIRDLFCFLPNRLTSCSPYRSRLNWYHNSSPLLIYPLYMSPSPKSVHCSHSLAEQSFFEPNIFRKIILWNFAIIRSKYNSKKVKN